MVTDHSEVRNPVGCSSPPFPPSASVVVSQVPSEVFLQPSPGEDGQLLLIFPRPFGQNFFTKHRARVQSAREQTRCETS